ncbi:MAG: DUF29 domain-containing protein [Microcystis sp. M015S2]|jgi:hypothetical protein|uniref:DUF29 domain-containing protein n=1 Tax=unclassified Microcystis TaxID=2643300 RepID=UPI002586F966|nr:MULTISPECIES: DUF29 domain-containing protein [unclassified Microcystis]MCA2709157.1 DUF29 domain-containing protein [Microcystis sp. M025S2]MCA2743003.1 DUF29 domain-containing protein [Microcystis sp. M015S2]MCA2757291.1 DUF29 domain-containing protein [Microcystis sp. M145S2]NCR42214.1 DUF29 domain-containing protein [Microcystis aeruginosa W13-11]
MNLLKQSDIQENPTTLYEQDLQLWIEQTIHQLQNRQFEQLDIENLIEELKDLGKSEKRALESNLMVLLIHLLKLKIQHDAPETMKASWYNLVDEHRQRVQDDLLKTPSLKSYLLISITQAYSSARKVAIKQGKRAQFGIRIPQESEYPLACPFTPEQILNEDFYG